MSRIYMMCFCRILICNVDRVKKTWWFLVHCVLYICFTTPSTFPFSAAVHTLNIRISWIKRQLNCGRIWQNDPFNHFNWPESDDITALTKSTKTVILLHIIYDVFLVTPSICTRVAIQERSVIYGSSFLTNTKHSKYRIFLSSLHFLCIRTHMIYGFTWVFYI